MQQKKNWVEINPQRFKYILGENTFLLEYKPKKINGEWENRYMLTGKVDNTTWFEHVLESTHLETAMKEVEREVLNTIQKQMRYHLDTSNKLAQMISIAL
jgi:hypothetical protein